MVGMSAEQYLKLRIIELETRKKYLSGYVYNVNAKIECGALEKQIDVLEDLYNKAPHSTLSMTWITDVMESRKEREERKKQQEKIDEQRQQDY